MPNFKKNTSSAMKKSAYKMKYNNSSFPFKESPMKAYEGSDYQNRRQEKAEAKRDADPETPRDFNPGFGFGDGVSAPGLSNPITDNKTPYSSGSYSSSTAKPKSETKAQTFNYNTGNWE